MNGIQRLQKLTTPGGIEQDRCVDSHTHNQPIRGDGHMRGEVGLIQLDTQQLPRILTQLVAHCRCRGKRIGACD